MLIKGITDEDFINYKLPSMYIATATCSFKCDKEYGKPICQNSELAKQPDIEISTYNIVERYLSNPITHAIVLGGLEPFDQFEDIIELIFHLRLEIKFSAPNSEYDEIVDRNHPKANDPVIIYTGYTKEEVIKLVENYDQTGTFDDWFGGQNIIIKYGRYIPGQQPHYDPVLGVYLASDNQYAERIS